MRLEQISNRVANLAERYEVPEHFNQASRKLGEVGEKVYRAALDNPKTSVAGIVLAAAVVGGALWYVFGNWRKPPVQRRRQGSRVRAGTERRRKHRAAARAAAT